MATVTTPAGDVLEGVTGTLLDYYRAEGYEVADDESEAVEFPIHFDSSSEVEHPGTGEEMHGIEHPADGTWSPEISNDPADAGPLDLH